MRQGVAGTGIAVNPERVRAARLAAGLSMAELGGTDVSRTFIHLVEKGASRPSAEVLQLIAKRTGKPVSYFTGPGSDRVLARRQLVLDLDRLAARLSRFRERAKLTKSERVSVRLLETSLRQGANLLRSL